jgi:hypothetical protein
MARITKTKTKTLRGQTPSLALNGGCLVELIITPEKRGRDF